MKTLRFSRIFHSTLQILGGGHFRKACRSWGKYSKQLEITCKQSEPARTISKIEKEENLYGHCAMNKAREFFSKGSTFLRVAGFGWKSFVFERISVRISMRWRGLVIRLLNLLSYTSRLFFIRCSGVKSLLFLFVFHEVWFNDLTKSPLVDNFFTTDGFVQIALLWSLSLNIV